MRPGGRGGRIKTGNPGNKGGGRTPDAFKRLMAEYANTPKALAYLKASLEGEHGPQAAASAREYVTERGYGKVPSVTKIQGDDDAPLTIRVVHT